MRRAAKLCFPDLSLTSSDGYSADLSFGTPTPELLTAKPRRWRPPDRKEWKTRRWHLARHLAGPRGGHDEHR